jgi:hypothetical protein
MNSNLRSYSRLFLPCSDSERRLELQYPVLNRLLLALQHRAEINAGLRKD